MPTRCSKSSRTRKPVGQLAVLAHADPRQVVAILAEQQPQTVAVLLAHMRPGARHASWRSSRVSSASKWRDERNSIKESIRPRSTQTTALIEAKLRSLHTVGALTVAGGASAIAEILNHSDRQTERQILGELESEDSELVEQIRASLFTFDDVIALDTALVAADSAPGTHLDAGHRAQGSAAGHRCHGPHSRQSH